MLFSFIEKKCVLVLDQCCNNTVIRRLYIVSLIIRPGKLVFTQWQCRLFSQLQGTGHSINCSLALHRLCFSHHEPHSGAGFEFIKLFIPCAQAIILTPSVYKLAWTGWANDNSIKNTRGCRSGVDHHPRAWISNLSTDDGQTALCTPMRLLFFWIDVGSVAATNWGTQIRFKCCSCFSRRVTALFHQHPSSTCKHLNLTCLTQSKN